MREHVPTVDGDAGDATIASRRTTPATRATSGRRQPASMTTSAARPTIAPPTSRVPIPPTGYATVGGRRRVEGVQPAVDGVPAPGDRERERAQRHEPHPGRPMRRGAPAWPRAHAEKSCSRSSPPTATGTANASRTSILRCGVVRLDRRLGGERDRERQDGDGKRDPGSGAPTRRTPGARSASSAISGRSRRKRLPSDEVPQTGEVERRGAAGHPVRREPGVVPRPGAVPVDQGDPAEVEPRWRAPCRRRRGRRDGRRRGATCGSRPTRRPRAGRPATGTRCRCTRSRRRARRAGRARRCGPPSARAEERSTGDEPQQERDLGEPRDRRLDDAPADQEREVHEEQQHDGSERWPHRGTEAATPLTLGLPHQVPDDREDRKERRRARTGTDDARNPQYVQSSPRVQLVTRL